MNWDEWCLEYPCLVVLTLPEAHEGKSDCRPEAENIAEKLEQIEDICTTFRVVEFEGMFYVVTKDQAIKLTGDKDV